MSNKRVWGLWSAAVVLVIASTANAASFDCRRAHAPDERVVCAKRDLNDQDVRVAVLYESTLHFMAMGARDAARERQRAWLAERRRCGSNEACLRRVYEGRVQELQRLLEQAYGLGPL